MSIPESFRKDADAMPAVLRSLLEAEIAAGNEIAEVGHTFPAPPAGAYFKLVRPLLTRPKKLGGGIHYYDRNSSLCSGEITTAKRLFFILEPPRPAGSESDNNAIRAAQVPRETRTISAGSAATAALTAPTLEESELTPMRRFENSMLMDCEKWHDGVGYDLDALHAMSPAEQKSAEATMIRRGVRDWRDIEALVCFATPEARAAIKTAIDHPNIEVRNAVMRCAPELVGDSVRTTSLVKGLETASFFGGLSETLDQVADFHPPLIVETLLRGVLRRDGTVAVHFAATLFYIHGQSPEPFDMAHRPFFLRFNTDHRKEREAAFRELCERIGVDAALYLANGKVTPAVAAEVTPDYTVRVDYRGETLTYCEQNRSADMICTFGGHPRILLRTLSSWYYPVGRRSAIMSAEEKEIILKRIVDYCRTHHNMTTLTVEAQSPTPI